MLDACFSHLYFCQSLHMLQHGLAAIADLLVNTLDKTTHVNAANKLNHHNTIHCILYMQTRST